MVHVTRCVHRRAQLVQRAALAGAAFTCRRKPWGLGAGTLRHLADGQVGETVRHPRCASWLVVEGIGEAHVERLCLRTCKHRGRGRAVKDDKLIIPPDFFSFRRSTHWSFAPSPRS